ncbi:MAG: PilN domain-containing protein [Phycisphaerales bacterium]|jgi:hypothetical protein|nr:PilN domain-containing protein [Phycisphaerales bacterium]MDP7574298.1 PilN domain-containing protein [Phycisphaerales bacterium]HJN79237.1 PilN domain-containing protein [Phycisphaerales bacterium]|tara:strand:- start:2132 stop:2848 length:717 start_codon:yes stop_codon:yes gene_type:complete
MNRPNDDFLPREYIEHKQDRRVHFAALSLFAIVLAGVVVAFFITRSDWQRVKEIREEVSIRYEEAADQVRLLSKLEDRQARISERAELAASLVDRLPRSVLLSEFINRMPEGLGLLEFELTSHLLPPTLPDNADAPSNRPQRGQTTAEAQADPRVEPPRWRTEVSLLGFAPTDVHVSAFLAALNEHPLLENVSLHFSEEIDLNELSVRQFRIKVELGPDADFHGVTPMLSAAFGALHQ